MVEALSLYELNSLVSGVLSLSLDKSYWLKAEISSVSDRGHCYLELVENNEKKQLVARAKAQIWKHKWLMLRPYFERETGQTLSAGLNVMLKVEVTFHPLYGYSLNVIDIDPSYTLGEMMRRRKEIIEALKSQGIADMNKELPLPGLLQRIAVISSASAAGYGDFCNQLNSNPDGLVFYTKLYPAIMQGNEVEESVISALDSIMADIDRYQWDAVVIIRGGGATTDLWGFDSLPLAECVAQFPIPVITGIGHERDDTVIDMISHTRVKTPTAAAEFLLRHQREQLEMLNDMESTIFGYAERLALETKNRLDAVIARMPSAFRMYSVREMSVIERVLSKLGKSAGEMVSANRNMQDLLIQRFELLVSSAMLKERHRLMLLDKTVSSADPSNLLRLGYSVTRLNGKALTSLDGLSVGDKLTTMLYGGEIVSEIKSMNVKEKR